MIVKFEIPIDNYYGDAVFYKELYFSGDRCPTIHEVKGHLQNLHQKELEDSEKHPEWGPWMFEYKQCLDALSSVLEKNFPFLTSDCCYESLRFVHTKWGVCHISAKQIIPIELI